MKATRLAFFVRDPGDIPLPVIQRYLNLQTSELEGQEMGSELLKYTQQKSGGAPRSKSRASSPVYFPQLCGLLAGGQGHWGAADTTNTLRCL